MSCARCSELERELSSLRREVALQVRDELVWNARARLAIHGATARLLAELLESAGTTVPLDRLRDVVTLHPERKAENLLRVQVTNLRNALADAGIRNAVLSDWGVGYRITQQDAERIRRVVEPAGAHADA